MTSTHAHVYMHDRSTGQEHAWSYGNCHHPVSYFTWSLIQQKALHIHFLDIQGRHSGMDGRNVCVGTQHKYFI